MTGVENYTIGQILQAQMATAMIARQVDSLQDALDDYRQNLPSNDRLRDASRYLQKALNEIEIFGATVDRAIEEVKR